MKIDFHSHILPGADHGSRSVETSLEQISILKSASIDQIVATPHFYPQSHSVNTFLSIRQKCADQLLEYLKEDAPRIYLGAEVLVCAGLENMDGLRDLCISGTDTLLLEMPLTSKWSESLYKTVYNISTMGFDIVLAHVDRYPLENVKRLMSETGAVGQLNVSACGSFFKNRRSLKYLETGRIVAIGSDIHGSDKECAKNMAYFLNWKNGCSSELFEKTEKYLYGAKSVN